MMLLRSGVRNWAWVKTSMKAVPDRLPGMIPLLPPTPAATWEFDSRAVRRIQ